MIYDMDIGKKYICKNGKVVTITRKENENDIQVEDIWLWETGYMFEDSYLYFADDGSSSHIDADEAGFIIIMQVFEETHPELFL